MLEFLCVFVGLLLVDCYFCDAHSDMFQFSYSNFSFSLSLRFDFRLAFVDEHFVCGIDNNVKSYKAVLFRFGQLCASLRSKSSSVSWSSSSSPLLSLSLCDARITWRCSLAWIAIENSYRDFYVCAVSDSQDDGRFDSNAAYSNWLNCV